MNIPDESVQAAMDATEGNIPPIMLQRALSASAPFLQGAVKKLEWGEMRHTDDYSFAQDAETPIGRYIATDTGWFLQGQSGWKSEDNIEAAKAAAQADYDARILSTLEPSAAREQALEAHSDLLERLDRGVVQIGLHEDNDTELFDVETACETMSEAAAAIRALSSPGHADAGKVEGDGWQELEQAARNLIANRFDTYKARNGKLCSIEGDDGEKCWIVSFDDMAELEAALPAAPASEGAE